MIRRGSLLAGDPVEAGHPLNRGRVAWWLGAPGRCGGSTFPDIATRKTPMTIVTGGGWDASPGRSFKSVVTTSSRYMTPGASVPLLNRASGEPWAYFWTATPHSLNSYDRQLGRFDFSFEIATRGTGVLAYYNGAVGWVDTTVPLTVGERCRLAVVQRGASIEVYKNGVLGHTGSLTAALASQLYIGAGRDGSEPGEGEYEDISFYDRAPSAAEVYADYDAWARDYRGPNSPLRWTSTRTFFLPPTASDGSASGTSTATGIGAATATATATATGTSTASGIGASTAASLGSAIGTGTAAAVGASTAVALASSAGTSTASGVGMSTASAVASSAGESAAVAIGTSTSGSTGSAGGTSTASAVGAASVAATGSASGTSVVEAISAIIANAVAMAIGLGTASGVGASTVAAAGSSVGTSTATGVSSGAVEFFLFSLDF